MKRVGHNDRSNMSRGQEQGQGAGQEQGQEGGKGRGPTYIISMGRILDQTPSWLLGGILRRKVISGGGPPPRAHLVKAGLEKSGAPGEADSLHLVGKLVIELYLPPLASWPCSSWTRLALPGTMWGGGG